MTAEVAFNRRPVYERWAPNQLKTFAEVERALRVQDAISGKWTATVSESKHPSQEHLPDI